MVYSCRKIDMKQAFHVRDLFHVYLNKSEFHFSRLHVNILRKTIEGYLDPVPSLTFNTIKTLLCMHAFHSSRHLQSKCMLYFSHASMV